MVTRTHPDPSPDALADPVAAVRRDGALVALAARCEGEYDGRFGSTLDPGNRPVVLKGEGSSSSTDRPGWTRRTGNPRARTSASPRTRPGRRSAVDPRRAPRRPPARRARRDPVRRGRRRRHHESGTESELRRRILDDPGVPEGGLRIVEHERETTDAFLDLFATDAEGRPAVVEVRRRRATLGQFDRLERCVGLCDDNEVRGLLAAPSATDRVRRTLRDHGPEFVRLDPDATALDREAGGRDATLPDFE